MSTIAEKLAGTPTRYTPPVCTDAPKCSHAKGFHETSGADHNENIRYFGLKWRGSELVFDRPKPMTPNTKPANIPSRTLQNVAACAALGLSYWAEHPRPNHLWAVDAHQSPHAVRVDRKTSKAEHACGRYLGLEHGSLKCADSGRIESWEVPPTMGDLMTLMDDTTATAVTDPVSANRKSAAKAAAEMSDPRAEAEIRAAEEVKAVQDHNRNPWRLGAKKPLPAPKKMLTGKALIKSSTAKGATRPKTAAEISREETNRAAAAHKVKTGTAYDANAEKPMSRAVARSLLLHDPDYLGDITNAALVDLLSDESVAAHHQRIRDELARNRGLTPVKEA